MKYSLRFYEGDADAYTPTQDQDPEYSGIDPTTGLPFAPGTGPGEGEGGGGMGPTAPA